VEPGYWVAKAILKPSFGTWFRWNIEGLEHVPPERGAIVAFNHIAYLDPLAAAYIIDKASRRPRFLAKAELFDDKRISWIIRAAGQIPVARGTKEAPMALDHAIDALDGGELVVIFPEGTITTDPDLAPMEAKSGIARLALQTGLPVIPAALWGTANVWTKGHAKNWRPGQDICARFGPSIDLSHHSDDREGWAGAGAQVMEQIGVLLAGLRSVVPDRRRPRRAA
jgi:1-acyl-sn-glycerol-3-phosphate acyltransferase